MFSHNYLSIYIIQNTKSTHNQLYEIMFHDFVSPCFCLSIVITGNSNIGNIAYLSPYIQLYGMLTSMYYSVVVSVNICNITHFVKLKITDNITKNLEVYLVPSVNIKKVKLKKHQNSVGAGWPCLWVLAFWAGCWHAVQLRKKRKSGLHPPPHTTPHLTKYVYIFPNYIYILRL